jgi:Protein of unknown function (DUF1501)
VLDSAPRRYRRCLPEEPRPLQDCPGFRIFCRPRSASFTCFNTARRRRLDLFDYKPGLLERRGTELPDSIRMGQRLTGMTAYQAKFPTAPSLFKFAQHGESGTWLGELLPHTSKVADDLCIIKSLQKEIRQ